MSGESLYDIVLTAQKILERYPLCDHCLGRQFAKKGIEMTNKERGHAIKVFLNMKLYDDYRSGKIDKEYLRSLAINSGKPVSSLYEKLYGEKIAEAPCYICGGKISEKLYDELAEKAAALLKKVNVYRFLVGVSIPQEIILREIEVSSFSGLEYSESIKNEIKREVGKRIMKFYGLEPDFDKPEAVVVIDYETLGLRLEINPLLFEGKYWKRGRNISHTIWTTREGVKLYPYSLQEFFNDRLKEIFDAEEVVIHASGREDVDARMLGTGRPLVIEIKNPRFRYVDLDLVNDLLKGTLIEAVIHDESSRSRIAYLKGEASKKKKLYKLLIMTENPVNRQQLDEIEKYFINREIRQLTPLRILRRKKEHLRRRKVYFVKTRQLVDNVFEALIYCDGGLYVKELVHGDQGRTTPSISEVLGVQAYPLELDVLVVEQE